MTDKSLPTTINFSDPKLVKTLKETVARGLNDSEFVLFAEHCRSTGLNPFKKEVWAIKAGERLQIMTGLNGFLAIANSHPAFDGMEVEVDTDPQGNPTKATCKVYRKDRKFPSVGIALMKEFRKDTPIWRQMPSVMLTKCAKSIAIREAFPQELGGLYTAEEMPPEYSAEANGSGNGNGHVIEVTNLKPADEIRPTIWAYDMVTVPEDKQKTALDYCRKQGMSQDSDTGLWVSKKRIPNLDKYQVSGVMVNDEGKIEIKKPEVTPNV